MHQFGIDLEEDAGPQSLGGCRCRHNAKTPLLVTMLTLRESDKQLYSLRDSTWTQTLPAHLLFLTILALRLEMNRRVAW